MTTRKPGAPIPPDQVRRLRDEFGMTQAAFAEHLGVGGGKSVISNWENGRAKCDGTSAELVLYLLGTRSLSLGMSSLSDSMERHWTRNQPAQAHWRQIAVVPKDDIAMGRDQLLSLFPDAAVPDSAHKHGFPFVEVSHMQPFGFVDDGWLGTIPFDRAAPISYLWRFNRRAGFGYREKLWEVGQELGSTGGHVFIGALFDVVAATFEFYRRLGERLAWGTEARLDASIEVAGIRGRGIAIHDFSAPDSLYGEIISQPTRVAQEDRISAIAEVRMPRDKIDVLANSIIVLGDLVAPLRSDCVSTRDLWMQLRARWHWDQQPNSGNPRLHFLTDLDQPGIEAEVLRRVSATEQAAPPVPASRRLQRTVLEYLEETPGICRGLGVDAGWAQRFKAPSVSLLADVIWYLAWRGFIDTSSESTILRPILEKLRKSDRPNEVAPQEFLQALKDGYTEVKLTTSGGDYLHALRRGS